MSQAGDFESEFGGDSSFNFWEPKQYMKSVKRYENAHKLCKDMKMLILERSEIEKQYSLELRKWNKKWLSYLETSVEFGTSKNGWVAFCNEAMDISKIHMDIRNQLADDVCTDVNNWQKEHFHKVNLPVMHYKEVKSLENEYETAQKPWSKRLKRVNICKKEYHTACKQEKSLFNSMTNAKNDSTTAADQVKKLEDKLKKAENDTRKTKASYEASLQDLDGDSTRYMEEMEKIFKKTQLNEEERMEFFKDIFFKIRNATNISENPELKPAYQKFESGINEMKSDVDLKNWSISYGATMVFQIPQFEDFTPEANSVITKKKTIATTNNSQNVVLKSVTTNEYEPNGNRNTVYDNNNTTPFISNSSAPTPFPRHQSYDESLNPFGGVDSTDKKPEISSTVNNSNINSINEVPTYDTLIVDEHKPGVIVRALYDYTKQDSDEISLTAGAEFEKLEDEDDQGWCKGRINGLVGLYPANYAEPI